LRQLLEKTRDYTKMWASTLLETKHRPNKLRRLACQASLLAASHPFKQSSAQTLSSPAANALWLDIQRYVALGEHRVGTKSERETANWLETRLRPLGFNTTFDTFTVRTLLNPSGQIKVAGESIKLFPQWLPPPNSLGSTLTGPLKPLEQSRSPKPSIRIVTQTIPFTANWTAKLDALVQDAVNKNASALVMAIDHSGDGLFVCNQHSRNSFPIPVALLAKRDFQTLASIAKEPNAREAKFIIRGEAAEVQSINVVGYKPGVGKHVVISTPLTGWFECGAERGPGIALWLRIATQLSTVKNPVLLLGTGSHEVGHFGMEHVFTHAKQAPPKPDDVALWLHFGASLAATKLDAAFKFKSPQALIARPGSMATAKQYLSAHLPIYVPGNTTTLGEAGQVIGAGYENFIGMSGFFPGFHTVEDKGQAVDIEALEKLADASTKLVSAFAA
jgi:hypothetical protein